MFNKRFTCETQDGELFELVIRKTGHAYPFIAREEALAFAYNGPYKLAPSEFQLFHVKREEVSL